MKNVQTTTPAKATKIAPAKATKIAPAKVAAPVKIPTIQADISGMVLTLTFSNGEEVIVDANNLKPEICRAAIMHGLKQKLVDAAAISRNPETGASATVQDKYEAVDIVAKRLLSDTPTWNAVRDGTGAGNSGGNSLLLRALVIHSGKSKEILEQYLDTKTKEEKAALKINPAIATIIARLQSESQSKTAGKVDSNALLNELA